MEGWRILKEHRDDVFEVVVKCKGISIDIESEKQLLLE
jgi:hypothetical protein